MKRRAARAAVIEAKVELPPPVASAEEADPFLDLDFEGTRGSPRGTPAVAPDPRSEDNSIKESIIRWLEQQM